MILVYVQHFLDGEGQRYFPTWLQETADVLRSFEGFVLLRQLTRVDESEGCYLGLEFASLDLLRVWSKSKEHDALIAKLAPYRLHKQRSQVFEVGAAL